jgi:ParB-like chromosome segregation protein Spo0J
MKAINDKYEMVKVSDLQVHPLNARKGNVDRIAESIRVNGFFGALIVQRSTNNICAGNHRFMAATQLGFDEVPVLWIDVDDDEARRILLADNRTNDVASYDNDLLVDLLKAAQETTGLDGTGYDEVDLADLLMTLEPRINIADLAGEWDGNKDTDETSTITLVLEREVADEFKEYLKDTGNDTTAVKNLLARL